MEIIVSAISAYRNLVFGIVHLLHSNTAALSYALGGAHAKQLFQLSRLRECLDI